MKSLKDLKVAYKLMALALIAVIGMAIIGFTGYSHIRDTKIGMDNLYNENMKANQYLNGAITDNYMIQSRVLLMIFETAPDKLQQRQSQIKKYIDDYGNQWKGYVPIAVPGNQSAIDSAQSSWQSYKSTLQNVADLANQGKKEEAAALYENQGSATAVKLRDDLNSLSDIEINAAKNVNDMNNASAQKAIYTMITEIIIFLVLLCIFCLWFVRDITSSLNYMIVICKKLSKGSYIVPKQRAMSRKDEFGQMADSLFDVIKNTSDLMKKMNNSIEQVAASSEELTASSSQSAQASTQVAQSATETATVVEEDKKSIANGQTAIEGIVTSINNIDEKTSAVAEHVSNVVNNVTVGNKSIEESVGKIKNVENTVTSSASIVEKLGKSSQEIGQIIDTISGIAGQTNLLALNAAIEAARAGEHGKGFAVVAEEVRKLAEQSQNATAKITELISSIQSDTTGAVEAMQKGRKEVIEGAKSVEDLRSMFEKINTSIEQVSAQMQAMSSSVNEVMGSAQNVKEKSAESKEHSDHISSEMQSISAATQQQSASAQEIASASEALAKMAQDTQTELHKFKF